MVRLGVGGWVITHVASGLMSGCRVVGGALGGLQSPLVASLARLLAPTPPVFLRPTLQCSAPNRTALKHPAVSGPVLLLYSRSDHLVGSARARPPACLPLCLVMHARGEDAFKCAS